MILNFVQTTFRNFTQYKLYTGISIAGLAVGLACTLIISLFVVHELSFDSHYGNSDRIYRVSRDYFPGAENTRDQKYPGIAPQVAPLMESEFPQIETIARLYDEDFLIKKDDIAFYELDYWADHELFEIFDFKWISGDPSTALEEPYTVVITQAIANKYFGNEEALGQTLEIADYGFLEVVGVIENLPENTHFEFSLLGSLPTLVSIYGEEFLEDWGNDSFYTYALLRDSSDAETIQSRSGAFFEKYYAEGASDFTRYTMTPLKDIYLRSDRIFEMGPVGSVVTVYTFSAIAIFVLLIASANFINLATANFSRRTKEIGVRKAIGAGRGQIFQQFLIESFILTLISALLAVVLVELFLPPINGVMGYQLTVSYFNDPLLLCWLAIILLFVGILGGCYPAFYLSSFRSVQALKAGAGGGRSSVTIREALIIFQFATSISLIIATSIVYLQIQHTQSVSLGYEGSNVVVVNSPPGQGFGSQWEAFKGELSSLPEISKVTASSLTPASFQDIITGGIRYEGGSEAGERGIPFGLLDFDFFETYGIRSVAGRTFSPEYRTDKIDLESENSTEPAFVLNESAVRSFAWTPEQAIGKWLEISLGRPVRGEVVGVVEDVNFKSIRTSMEPMVYFLPPERFSSFLSKASLKISGGNVQETLNSIESVWSEFFPAEPMISHFIEQDYAALYQREEKEAWIFSIFTIIALLISSFGLFGLATFNAETRTKEIGVRKVMGGSVWSIVLLLTNDFSKLVLISNVIAWPVAYIAMNRWLENFAYRIDLTPLIFIGSGLIALCIAWVTVGGTAAKAASAKPVLALRYE